jgi:hypothetical protein
MAREIDRAELLERLQAGEVTLVDAQGPGWFEKGAPARRHPGPPR